MGGWVGGIGGVGRTPPAFACASLPRPLARLCLLPAPQAHRRAHEYAQRAAFTKRRREEEAKRAAFREHAEAASRRILEEQRQQDAAWRAAVAEARCCGARGEGGCLLALAAGPAGDDGSALTACSCRPLLRCCHVQGQAGAKRASYEARWQFFASKHPGGLESWMGWELEPGAGSAIADMTRASCTPPLYM